MEIYVPDIYQKNIYEIDYEVLVSRGIKCLIFDLDNTLVTILETTPREETKELFRKLKKMGFKIYIASNSIKARVKPFHEELKVDYIYSVKKLDSILSEEQIWADEANSKREEIARTNKLIFYTIIIFLISIQKEKRYSSLHLIS